MRRVLAAVAIAVGLLSSCGDNAAPVTAPSASAPETTVAPATAPSTTDAETATPPVTDAPTTIDASEPSTLSVEISGFRFELEAVDAECVVLTTTTPDDGVFTRETCPSRPWVNVGPGCLSRPRDGGESDTIGACDVEAPSVFYGRATGGGHVCVPSLYEIGIGRVRFIPFNEDGLYLAAVDPDTAFPTSGDGSFMFDRYGRSFTSDGERIDPYKEDFETPIFELCERLAPWDTGELGPSDDLIYRSDIEFRADAANDLAGRLVRFDFGPGGRQTYNNGTLVLNDLAYLPYPVTPTLTIGGVQVELAFDPVPDLERAWRLILSLQAGAVTEGDDGIVIDPELVTLVWEEG